MSFSAVAVLLLASTGVLVPSAHVFARARPSPESAKEALDATIKPTAAPTTTAVSASHAGKMVGAFIAIGFGVIILLTIAALLVRLFLVRRALASSTCRTGRIKLPFNRSSRPSSCASSIDLESNEKPGLRPLVLVSTPTGHTRSASIESYTQQLAVDEFQPPPGVFVRPAVRAMPDPVNRAALAQACAKIIEDDYKSEYCDEAGVKDVDEKKALERAPAMKATKDGKGRLVFSVKLKGLRR